MSRPSDKEKEALASPKRKLLETEAPLEYSVRQMGRSLLFWVLFVIFGLSRLGEEKYLLARPGLSTLRKFHFVGKLEKILVEGY